MLKLASFDVAALRALAHGLEADPVRAAGRGLLRRFTDPNSAATRLWARLMAGDSQIYNVDHLMKQHLANPAAGGMAAVNKALGELGETATRRQGTASTIGKLGLLGGAGYGGAKLLGEPAGRQLERQDIGNKAQANLPAMPLSHRLGAALKTVFAPSSMGKDINSGLNQ